MIGKIIGNYEITGELAQGGMGAVYRARHLTLPREVVVKSILLSSFPPHLQAPLKARFLREALVQSQLDHPNIVRVIEFFTAIENYFLVMEYVAGLSLRDLLKRQGRLPPDQALELFKQALVALEYAHTFSYVDEAGARHTGITHRDIKPANLLIDGMGRLKLTDFGIVKLAGEQALTRTGFNPGTAEYMSPEQIRGFEVDTRSDLYSMGVTLYEMLAGRLPFPHTDTGSEYEIMRGHIELTPPPLADADLGLSRELSDLVQRSLEKDLNARFQTAGDFLKAIQAYERRGVTAPQSVRPPQPPLAQLITELLPVQETNPVTDGTLSRKLDAPVPNAAANAVVDAAATNVIPPSPTQQPPQATTVPPTQRPPKPAPQSAPPQIKPAPGPPRVEHSPVVSQAPAAPSKSGGNRLGLIVLLAVIALGGVAFAAVLWWWSQQTIAGGPDLSPSPTPVISTPTPATGPSVTPSTAPSAAPSSIVADAWVQQARTAEEQENYRAAIQSYEAYLSATGEPPDAAEVRGKVAQLKNLQGLLVVAELGLERKDFATAKRDFADALKLKPDSKLAQTGLSKAEAGLKK
jgi:eukaryotic-like serine/threonine-protein kinase